MLCLLLQVSGRPSAPNGLSSTLVSIDVSVPSPEPAGPSPLPSPSFANCSKGIPLHGTEPSDLYNEDWEDYRLSDCMTIHHAKLYDTCENLAEEHPSSLLARYRELDPPAPNASVAANLSLLAELVRHWPLPDGVEERIGCAIHVRAGDVIECDDHTLDELLHEETTCTEHVWATAPCSGRTYVRPLQYYTSQFEELGMAQCNNVMIVSGSQWANSSHRQGEEGEFVDYPCAGPEKSIRYLEALRDHLCHLGAPSVQLRLGQPPDDDFAILSRSKVYSGSGGGFDTLISEIRTRLNSSVDLALHPSDAPRDAHGFNTSTAWRPSAWDRRSDEAPTPAYKACLSRGNASGTPRVGWLWSFPGSGNTVTRLLVDAASGHPSGSIYHDQRLADVLSGEMLNANHKRNYQDMLFVKTHAFHYDIGTPDWPPMRQTALLYREPYAAILAQYALMKTGSHTGTLTQIDDPGDFSAAVLTLAQQWAKTLDVQLDCKKGVPERPCGSTHIVSLEELLTSPDRAKKLRSLVEFGGVTVDDERLRCAFEHAETFHRTGGLSVAEAFCGNLLSAEVLDKLAATLQDGISAWGYAPLDCDAQKVQENTVQSWALP